MCGVIGVHLRDVSHDDLLLVDALFRQSMIRGKHATGATYLKEEHLITIKESIPADQFMDKWDVADWVDDTTLRMIGHIRYSTSDLRYNQPFQNEYVAIAHNGVISQDPDVWEFETETENDSELILRAKEHKHHPLRYYANRSMAVTEIYHTGQIQGYRNHERPLWYAERDNGIFFASTEDILDRAGIRGAVKCKPFVQYIYDGQLLEIEHELDRDYEDLQ